jgi:hypothetical protein
MWSGIEDKVSLDASSAFPGMGVLDGTDSYGMDSRDPGSKHSAADHLETGPDKGEIGALGRPAF